MFSKMSKSLPARVTPMETDEPPIPEKPRLVGTPTDTTISITWEVHGNVSAVLYYTIQYRVAKEDGRKKQQWNMVDTKDGSRAFQFHNLLPNTGYQFKVSSNTAADWSPLSEASDVIWTKTLQTQEKVADTQNLLKGPIPVPLKPTLTDEPTHTSVPLGWRLENGDCSSVTHYTVAYKCVHNNADLTSVGKWEYFDTKDASCTCVIDELHPDTPYRFFVSSNTEKGRGPPSPISDNICTDVDPSTLVLDRRVTSQQRPHNSGLLPNRAHDAWRGADCSIAQAHMSIGEVSTGNDTWLIVGRGRSFRNHESSYRPHVGSHTDQARGPLKREGDPYFADGAPEQPCKPQQAGSQTHSSIPIRWAITGDSRYTRPTHYTIIYQRIGRNGDGPLMVIDTPNTATSYTIDTLDPSTCYRFQIASNNHCNQSPPSQFSDIIETSPVPIRKTTDNTTTLGRTRNLSIPACPGIPYLTGTVSEDTVPLKWEVGGDASSITHYTLEFKKAKDKGRWLTIKTDDATTKFIVKDLDPDTNYHFRVSSNTDQAQSRPSKLSNIIKTGMRPTYDDMPGYLPPRPSAPIAVGTPNHDSIVMTWEVTENTSGVTYYTITYRVAGQKGHWITVETEDKATKFTIDELKPNTPYQFRVSANTADCQSSPSDISDTIKTSEEPKCFQAVTPMPKPEKPKSIGIPGLNQVQLVWKLQGNTDHITHFTLTFRAVGVKHWITMETEDAETFCIVDDLEPDTPYQFRVASNSDQGQSSSSEVSDTIRTAKPAPMLPEPTPPKPYRLTRIGQAAADKLTLAWKLEGDESAVIDFTIKYKIIREATEEKTADTWKIHNTGNTDFWCTLENLDPDTLYHICIEANTKDGKSYPGDSSDNYMCTAPVAAAAAAAVPAEPEQEERESVDSTPVKRPLPAPDAPKFAPGIRPTQKTMSVVWNAATDEFPITHFTLEYKAVREKADWKEIEVPGVSCEYTLSELQVGTAYLLRVKAETPTDSSCWSDTSEPLFTESRSKDEIYRQHILSISTPAKTDRGMPLFQVPLELTEWDEMDRIRRHEFGTPSDITTPEKVLLVVGATGAGKSTLINGFFNYVVGVEWTEDFRFRMVQESGSFESQHESQTKMITVYKLHHQRTFKVPYTLTIIDTPGFGDTAGIEKDKLIVESIGHLFRKEKYGVDHIDAIGFVVQSSLARLTPTQKYIFDSILSLFGKDIGDNISLMITFSDSQRPPVLASTKQAKIPYKSHYKFNNSALYAKNDTEDDEFDQMFWKMGAMSFRKFLWEMNQLQSKSLCLTKEVLDEREHLEVHVNGIQQEIRSGLNKLEQFRVEINVVKQHEADIEKNRNFIYTVDEHKMVEIPLDPGRHVTNCLTCNRTCHYPCYIPKDEDKSQCAAMDRQTGNCTVCPENCIWNMHRNVPFRIEVETETVQKTSEELKKRYEQAKGEKMNAEKLTNKILEDFYNLEVKVLFMTTQVRRGLERLSEIALRPNPLSTVEFLDILIRAERSEAKPGFQARIDHLEHAKAHAKTLCEMAKDGYDPFDDFRAILSETESAKHRPSFQEAAAKFKKKHNFSSIVKSTASSFFRKIPTPWR